MRKTCLAVAAALLLSSLVQPALSDTPEGAAAPAANSPPTADISEPRNGAIVEVMKPVVFDGSNSTDPDNDTLRYKWQFGDGGEAFTAKTTHAYTQTGLKIVNLTVNDSQAEDRSTIIVQVVAKPDPNNLNVPPKAAIDGNKTGYTTELIFFTSLATDSNSDNLSYYWDFGDDRFVNLLNPDDEGKTVTHGYNSSGNYTVTHWVQETNTTERYISNLATVWANISSLPVFPPLADAGPDVRGEVNAEISLSGAGAAQNPDGRITNFEWDFENDGVYDWTSNTTGKAKHAYTVARSYVARLRVTDDRALTAEDATNVTITAPPNKLPVANAGDDRTAFVGQAVSLEGTATDEDGQIIRYQWDYEGDGVWDYESPSSGMGNWVFRSPGTYEALFRVTDDRGGTAEDSAVVTVVLNQPPSAEAGEDQSVSAGDIVQFDGSGSRDPEGGKLSFSWDFDDRDGLQNEGSGPMVDQVYAKGGEYTVTLTVTDDLGQTAKDTAVVTVTQTAGVSLAVNPRSLSLKPNQEGLFTVTVQNSGNGRDSFDLLLSGDNYRWATIDAPVVVLDGGATSTVTLRVTPPVDAAAAAQAKVTLRAVSGFDPNVVGQSLVTVTVLQGYHPVLTPQKPRQTVEAGQSVRFWVQIANGGNGDDTVRLAASGAAGRWTSFTPQQVVVFKGTTKSVTVKVSVPRDAAAQDYMLTLTATSGDNLTQSLTSITLTVKAAAAASFVPGPTAAAFLAATGAATVIAAVFRRRRTV